MPYRPEKKVLRIHEQDHKEFADWQRAIEHIKGEPISQADMFATIVTGFGKSIRDWLGIRDAH